MSPNDFRQAGIMLASCTRPTGEMSAELGEAMLQWLEDPNGLPFEAYLGINRTCEISHPTRFRDELCRQYVNSLPKMSTSSAANLIIDRVIDCNYGLSKPDDYGPVFVVFYKQFNALNFKLPEHRTLRRIIG